MPRHWRQGDAASRKVVPLHAVRAARPAPPRRIAPLPLGTGTRVLARPHAQLTAHGTVVGVARMAPARYDVQLDNGQRFDNLSADQVEEIR